MRAAVVTALTGPDAVEVQEVDEPRTADHQVLVDVEYAGVTFPDVLQTRGQYQLRPEPAFIPGWEVSGVVRSDAHGFRTGDRVAALPMAGRSPSPWRSTQRWCSHCLAASPSPRVLRCR